MYKYWIYYEREISGWLSDDRIEDRADQGIITSMQDFFIIMDTLNKNSRYCNAKKMDSLIEEVNKNHQDDSMTDVERITAYFKKKKADGAYDY